MAEPLDLDGTHWADLDLRSVVDECRRLRSEIEQRDEMIGKLREYVDWLKQDTTKARKMTTPQARQLRAAIGRSDDGTWIAAEPRTEGSGEGT